VESILTTCPFCACGCAVYLHTRDARLAGVAPSEHHPVSQGRLCARGWNAHEAPTWGERLTRPMVRRGGTLEPTSWENALEVARDLLSALLRAGKNVGVLGSARATNEENYLAARLARGALHTGNLDSCLRATYQPLVTGIASVAGGTPRGTLEDVERSECILVLESDLASTHPQAVHAIIKALKAGARLVTIGYARTQLARLASLHLSVLPGERALLLASLAAEVLRESTARALPGFDALEASLAGTAATDQVRRAAEWLAHAGRASILISPEGAPAARLVHDGAAAATLAALTGHLGRPGCALLPLPARGNLRGACEMGVTPDLLPGGAGLTDPAATECLALAWGTPPTPTSGLAADGMIGGVSGLVVVAEDLPATPAVRQDALARLECLIVLDAFTTPTTRAANIVLPIASFAENEGTTTSMEGRVQRVRAATRPPGEARHGWQVLAELAAALGLPCSYGSADDVLREIARVIPAYHDASNGVKTDAWGTFTSDGAEGRKPALRPLTADRVVVALPEVLALDGVFDWGSDPLVAYSPTLCRDHVARRKLYPRGLVEMSRRDADGLGVRQGWTVRLASAHGEAVVPVVLRDDLEQGSLLVPYAFRERVAEVLGGHSEVAVKAQRVG